MSKYITKSCIVSVLARRDIRRASVPWEGLYHVIVFKTHGGPLDDINVSSSLGFLELYSINSYITPGYSSHFHTYIVAPDRHLFRQSVL